MLTIIHIVPLPCPPYRKQKWLCQRPWYPRRTTIRHLTPRFLVKSEWWETLTSPYIFFQWSKSPCIFNSFQFPLQRYPCRLWHTTGHNIIRGIFSVPLCLCPIPKPQSLVRGASYGCFTAVPIRRSGGHHNQPKKTSTNQGFLGNPKACLYWSSLLHPRQFFCPSPNIFWGILNKNIMLQTVCPQ